MMFIFELSSHEISTRHAKIINSEAAKIDLYVWDIGVHYLYPSFVIS